MTSPDHLRVLLVGKGGREHALAWKLSQSPLVEHVYVVPGNGGTADGIANVSNVEDASMSDFPALVKLAEKLQINLVVVGPDDAVVGGIEGYFRRAGIPCFAPTQEAAELEGSKTYAKDFMRRHDIPTADYATFDDYDAAREYVGRRQAGGERVVIKASGLAAGKGVIMPTDPDEAQTALRQIMLEGKFGTAGHAVVIEDFLDGDEISVLTLSDGHTTRTLPPGQDHKRVYEADQGPNTGGMGVYAPTLTATPEVMRHIEEKILKPTFDGLKAEGRPFTGVLFTGIMLTATGPKVLEYNVRFGDPETQSLLPLLTHDTDLAALLYACTQATLHHVPMHLRPGFACNVVLAAGGYPGSYRQGDRIDIGPMPEDILVFHAGTRRDDHDGTLITAGGRVLCVVAAALTLPAAISAAYRAVDQIRFRDMYCRRDIGYKALAQLRDASGAL